MAGSPRFKVYNPQAEYVAACRHCEDAACLVALYGEGATIRWQHGKPIWVEGKESQKASESYDFVAEVVRSRILERQSLT
jgi:hypothetical protein